MGNMIISGFKHKKASKQQKDQKKPSSINELSKPSCDKPIFMSIFRNTTGYKDDPNEEIDRLHSQHYLYRHAWKGNFSAPIHERLIEGIYVLDVGCGPGTWLLDMASSYPTSKFMGIDLFPQFPSEVKPKNCEFLTADLLEGLPFEWNEQVIKELTRLTKPGGFVELMDVHMPARDLPPKAKKISDMIIAEMERDNLWWDVTSHFEFLLSSQLNLSGVTSQKKKHVIVVKEDDQEGGLFLEYFVGILKIVYPQISKKTNISPEVFYNEFMPRVIEEFSAKEHSPYILTERVFAQKIA
ncbi:5562_t:CDS:2 [Ambispora leptoticha]|uniref:5562_t:CDS:1 n=1 Tax=Ambispora leptoticha TaxID=144679 RepID=A0A9N9A869_9GLOM|nr:5562_t:CDS:2 [Ambispora leptoticha]